MVNIRTRIATVNFVFSTPRNAASVERKLLQYTPLSNNFHHCTLSEQEPIFLHYQTSLPVFHNTARS